MILLIFVCYTYLGWGQDNKTQSFIKIKGRVFDRQDLFSAFTLMVINEQSNTGVIGSPSGEFTIYAGRYDTLLISALGYQIKKICFKDSLPQNEYSVSVELQKKTYTYQISRVLPQVKKNNLINSDASGFDSKQKDSLQLKDKTIYLQPIPVYVQKKLTEIEKDLDKLRVRQTDLYKASDLLSSPITALYEAFSKIERSKRKVAVLENEDYKKSLLKDLFRIYIKADIINLSGEEFDNFIWYCNFSQSFIKNASQFELVMAIKERYEVFSKNKIIHTIK